MFDFDWYVLYEDVWEYECVSADLFKSKPVETTVETLPCVVLLGAELYAFDKCSDVGGMLSFVSWNRNNNNFW